VDKKPDLYGPFWVCTTIIFTITASSNFSKLFYNTSAAYNFTYVPDAIALVYTFGFVLPIAMAYLMKFFGSEHISVLSVVCIYGYSNVVLIPVILACCLPF